MARIIGRVTALTVARLRHRGRYPDGGDLYLEIGRTDARSWLFRYMLHGRSHEMDLGPLQVVSLADARHRARTCRQQLLNGINPLEARRQAVQQSRAGAAKSITLKDAAKAYITAHKAGWKNEKHTAQWSSTLETYAFPVFGLSDRVEEHSNKTRSLEQALSDSVKAAADAARKAALRFNDAESNILGMLEYEPRLAA